MNNVKVNVKFINEVDGNLDLYTLKVDAHYSIPETLGFSKSKALRATLIKDATLQEWIKRVNKKLSKKQVRSIIQSMILEDIMSRLQRASEKGEPEIMNQVLNILNQMKFDFSVDLEEAKEIISNTNKAVFPRAKSELDSLFE